ncbi:hypothetical protein F5J12DRAFT_787415 [Pisolithus orientalis]|uniref:uncharacterized protein n=1 Tax=Pisolithus orientalis TaxID=936130 RepID=UPI0022253EFF|nr:uncharacterized protein F5J12DRAFT_787415 [Pisolithus orientalis]KAI5985311.1 hypothetical protein F5J12DRAFT_787415 [Pisolithus orientalis]
MTPERPVKNVGKQIKSPLQPREKEKEKKITMLPCPQPLGANTHIIAGKVLQLNKCGVSRQLSSVCGPIKCTVIGHSKWATRHCCGVVRMRTRNRNHSQVKEKQTGNTINQHTLSIRIKHTNAHTAYYDVTMPLEIQALYPHVTPAQVHSAWMKMSEILWKKDTNQLTSARTLLDECSNEVDIFDMKIPDGVEQICWGMKKISGMLEGKAVEIALDATYNTNAKHLELYSVLAEYDNAGFPLTPNVAKFEGRVLLEHDEIPHDNIMPSLSNHIPNPSFSITTKPDISPDESITGTGRVISNTKLTIKVKAPKQLESTPS